jgi:DNA modification methylase
METDYSVSVESDKTFPISVSSSFEDGAQATLIEGDSLEVLRSLPSGMAKLVVTSPPYKDGKEYEKTDAIESYLEQLTPVIRELYRIVHNEGSVAWQVGNFVDRGEVFPLDIWFYPLFKQAGFKLRNRIVWHFDHGLHAKHRLSGRYETMLWFTKGDDYTWNLDPIRVPSKYPGKLHFKPGPKYGKPSGNPLGKNPSDIWRLMAHEWETCLWDIPNVKANHPEKTIHPCSFPIELVERCVLSMTNENDVVLDPFSGVGSAALAALRRGRRSVGVDRDSRYIAVARQRIDMLSRGTLPYRTLGKPVHQPSGRERVCQVPVEWADGEDKT